MIVTEGAPGDILTTYSADTLETAFLKLCCAQDQKITQVFFIFLTYSVSFFVDTY